MKKIKNVSKIILEGGVIVALLFATVSCNNSQKQEDPQEVAEEHNDAKMNNNADEMDAQFLVDASEINMKEIQLGQLAQQKAMMSDVKDLGKMMESEHTKAMNELKDLAEKKIISIPTSLTDEYQKEYNNFADKKAMDFDKDYCDAMVAGHKDAVNKFEKASTDATDPDIKAWAAATLPALRNHLDHAMTCQEKCKKM